MTGLVRARFAGRLPRLLYWLWLIPLPVGIYDTAGANHFVLRANHRLELAECAHSGLGDRAVLALDTGGYRTEEALAFGLVAARQVNAVLQSHAGAILEENRVVQIPACLARALGWEDGSLREGWTVQVADPGGAARATPAALERMGLRLARAAGLFLGQVAVFAVPVGLFGLPALATALLVLFINMLLLALGWEALPGPGWVKGLATGLVVALVGAVVHAMGWYSFESLGGGLVSAVLFGFWMGIILSGSAARSGFVRSFAFPNNV